MNHGIRRTSLRLAAVSAVAALALAGCGDEGDVDTNAGGGNSDTEVVETDPESEQSTEPGPEAADSTSEPGGDATETGPVEDPTEDVTEDPTEDGTGPATDGPDSTQTAPSGTYADLEASLAAYVEAETAPSQCPFGDASTLESAVNAAGPGQVSVDEVEVDIEASGMDGVEIVGVICTGTTGEEQEEAAGIGVLALGGGMSVQDFLGESGAPDSEPVGPGPDGVGEIMALCESGECVAYWYDENVMVAALVSTEGATVEQVTAFIEGMVPEVLATAESLG